MNIKQKLTLGIAAIFMITLTIVGVSYAYFVTRVKGITTTNVEIVTAQYGVEYGDGNNIVSLNNAIPGNSIYKVFTVTNPEKVPSTYQITLTQSVPEGAQEFLHFSDDGITCYQDTVTKSANSECFNGSNYNDLTVTVKEYKGTDISQFTETEIDQSKLKTAFEDTSNQVIGTTTNLVSTAAPQNIGGIQTIEGKTSGTDVKKIYILKVEFVDVKKNQNAEMSALVDIKIDLV